MTENDKTSDNIFFSFTEEMQDNDDELELSELINEIYNLDLTNENNDLLIPQFIHYKENFTVKELLLICEYYGIAKEVKTNKFNKDEIIHFLVMYESNPSNSAIVCKRRNMWFYINELKNDKFMKKHVLW